jgi:hypothetical protein
MIPKEKAEQLINKFFQYNRHIHYDSNVDEWIPNYYESKQCALVAVDEIIEFMETDDFDSDTCYWANHSKMEYWLDVKKEIEAL